LTLAALAAPLAACGDDQVAKARKDIREKANELKGNIDNLSTQDLRKALRDAEDAAKNGSADTKREARRLERRVQRELNSRN
jgi:polyhydroxyalkanoate synthesis regulator phasin